MKKARLLIDRILMSTRCAPAQPVRRRIAGAVGSGLVLLTAFAAQSSRAASIIWSAASGTDTNWSNGANWVGGVAPTNTDDVKFFDAGTNGTPGVANNLADAAFSGLIGSLQFANTNGSHTTVIASGLTLTLTNTGGLTMFTPADPGTAKFNTNNISGAGGALVINNTSANINVSQGSVTAGSVALLNLSGLDTLSATIGRIGLGSDALPVNGSGQYNGSLYLAKTNTISLAQSAPLAAYVGTPGSGNNQNTAIDIMHTGGNPPTKMCSLYLGMSNVFFVDSLRVGGDKASASSAAVILFNPAFTNGGAFAYFRGTNGSVDATSRIKWWAIGDMGRGASGGNVAIGTNDFSNGAIDILVDTISLGRDPNAAENASGNILGVLTFNNGTIDANTIYAGNQVLNTGTIGTSPIGGIINVVGPAATLIVNSNLVLARTSITAPKVFGRLNIRDGTVRANTITVGATSATNSISMTNGTLVLSNTLASPATGLNLFSLTNSTLQLNVPASLVTNIVVTNLVTGGATNIIRLSSVAIQASYPAQATLIKYSSASIGGVGYNFGFGANPLPGTAPGAYLSNNVANKSIDLALPFDPRPVILGQPASFSGSPNDNVPTNFTVTISSGSVLPLAYQWYYYTNGGSTNLLADGPGPGGLSTLSGSTTSNLVVTSAQTNDSGNFFAVISNVYGTATSSVAVLTISSGCSPPFVTGPVDQTVIQSNNATFSAGVSANPAAALQWQRNGVDVPGANSTTLIVTNVQYPADDQAVYSIIATNDCGNVTNSAILTVIVTPNITMQPTNLVTLNGASAAFYVTATGVPTPGYVWRKNGSPLANSGTISGVNTPTLSFSAVSPADTATYSVSVTNAAGIANSVDVTLTVVSTMSPVTLAPVNAATGVCYDTPFYITFSQTPVLRSAGKIRIFNATNTVTPVETLDLALGNPQARSLFPGDSQPFNYYPVIITGTTAAIYPHSSAAMTFNQTYYVTVDSGVFADTAGAYFVGISDTNAWRFATKPTGPANPTNLVVAANGSGDFVTVQGAVDSIPLNSLNYKLINIRNGNYVEIVDIAAKHNVTFRGQSRAGTVVGYANNANIAPGGTTHARMAFKVNARDISIENLTITNSTPQGGSQAEALMVESGASRFILNYADVDSRQDTILANVNTSQGYFYRSTVRGNFDYIWGGGNLFFTNCEIQTITGANGNNVTAARTDAGATGNWPGFNSLLVSNGFSFVHCRFTRSDTIITNVTLAGSNGTTNGDVAWIQCYFDTNCYRTPAAAVTNSQLLWEYGNSNLDGTAPVAFGLVALTNNDPRLLAAANATVWLNGWVPQLAPNILTNPADLTVNGGQGATFTVTATGIPDPSYQWLKNGTNLIGQTGASLSIPAAYLGDAGAYSVIVSNIAGSVTSTAATLTVGNSAPSLTPVSDLTLNVGVTANVPNVATDPDVPPQTLTFTLLSGPGSVDSGSGVFTWRPTVSFSDTTNAIAVVVTDNGTPNLSATNSFNVIVNPLGPVDFTSSLFDAGQFTLTISGDAGPDYALQASTNLVDWDTLLITNSPASPFTLVDTNSSAYSVRFYRVKAGPPLP